MHKHAAAGALAAAAVLAGCSSAPAPAPAPARSPSPSATASCAAYLRGLYAQLGGAEGAGRFQAQVNAESFAGTLGKACAGTARAQLMHLAAQAAGGK